MNLEAGKARIPNHQRGVTLLREAMDAFDKATGAAAKLVKLEPQAGRVADAALEIKRRFAVPVIFVTANTDPVTHARAMQAAPLAIISKPFSQDSLLKAVALLRRLN